MTSIKKRKKLIIISSVILTITVLLFCTWLFLIKDSSTEIDTNSEFKNNSSEIIVNRTTPLLTEPATGKIIMVIDENAILHLREIENPMWVLAETENGETGYVFTADISYLSNKGVSKEMTVRDEEISKKIAELEELLPAEKYWNRMGEVIYQGVETPLSVTDLPCNHAENGTLSCNFYNCNETTLFPDFDEIRQCLAFVGYLSDNLFGEETLPYYLEDFNDLRIGDHIRLINLTHSMMIVSKTNDTITVAEVNENYSDCMISWERKLTKEDLASYGYGGVQYISRYPTLENKDKSYYFNDIKLSFVNEYGC